MKKLQGLAAIAERLECSMAQLALAWTIKIKDVTTCLIGATKTSQLEANLGSLAVAEKLTPEILEEIEGILGNRPEPETNYKTWDPLPHRR